MAALRAEVVGPIKSLAQVRQALEFVGAPARAAVYTDPGASGLDANRPGLRRLLADVRRGGIRRLVVRDLARLARSAWLLETIQRELRAAGVALLIVEGAERHALRKALRPTVGDKSLATCLRRTLAGAFTEWRDLAR